MVEKLRPAEYARQRWKNDGGETLEIAADADDTPPAWRISIATIERDGPFSDFSGFDRTIVALDEGPIHLTVDGHSVPLRRFEPFEFRGESAVNAALQTSSSRDLNVMTRRDAFAHDVEVIADRSIFLTDDDELVFAYVAHGSATIADLFADEGETVYLDGEERFAIEPVTGSVVCVARITPR